MNKTFDKKKFLNLIENNAIVCVLLLMVVYCIITEPTFVSLANFRNLLSNTSVRFIVALGISGCLITCGNDLSAGRTVGLAACISATLLQRPESPVKFFDWLGEYPIIAVLALVVCVCACIGLVNGLVVSYLKVPPFIATLGMQTLVYGLCLVYTKAKPLGDFRPDYVKVANGQLFGIPNLAIIATIVAVIMWILYNKTRYGKNMYAIGGNENAAEVSGVNVAKSKIKIYMLASALFALAGFLVASKSGSANSGMGTGWELEAIAACTIGGVSTTGGVGKVPGILIGVLVFETLKICMQFLRVDPSLQFVVQGIVIIVAVALDIRKTIAKK